MSVSTPLVPVANRAERLAARPLPTTGGSDAEIHAGLLAAPYAYVSSKYLYDALGSQLFTAITRLPEYYLTRAEQAVLHRHASDIARLAGTGATLIDLGAGNCEKAAQLIPALRPRRYMPLDIAADFMAEAANGLRQRFPDTAIEPLAVDFTRGLDLPPAQDGERRVFFYPGSSIGNFAPADAMELLEAVRGESRDGDGLLIGIDLVKPSVVLNAAYNDSLGVTAAFNLNLLNHLNALIGSDFKVADWRHRAGFNAVRSRIEMHVEARRDTLVQWRGGVRRFRAGERIHTENSYKYRLADFTVLLQRAGYGNIEVWTDPRAWFAVCYASL